MNNKRMIVAIFWIVLGVILTACNLAGVMDEYWSGMGVAFIVVGALQLFRQIKYRTNEAYREKVNIETGDERNRYIGMKAWAWAGYLFILLVGSSVIVLKLMGQDLLSQVASYAVCLMLVLYWISYLILRKKYSW